MLTLKQVNYYVGERPIIKNFNLQAKQGETLALLGSNGAGKTTLLKLAEGLKKPDSGEVLWKKGHLIKNRPRIGFLGHDLYLYEDLTLRQNLKFFSRLYQTEKTSEEIFSWLKRLGLELYAGDRVENLSRGMKQRLAICRCFFISPQLILLDEPYTGLDLSARQILKELLQKYSHCPVLFTSHDIDRALGNCQRWVLLKNGRLVNKGDSCEKEKIYNNFSQSELQVKGS